MVAEPNSGGWKASTSSHLMMDVVWTSQFTTGWTIWLLGGVKEAATSAGTSKATAFEAGGTTDASHDMEISCVFLTAILRAAASSGRFKILVLLLSLLLTTTAAPGAVGEVSVPPRAADATISSQNPTTSSVERSHQ